MLEEEKGRWGDVFWQRCCSVKLPLLSAASILLLRAYLSGSMSSCHCSGQKSAQIPIVLHSDLQLQPVLPSVSALCRVCETECHFSAKIRGCRGPVPAAFSLASGGYNNIQTLKPAVFCCFVIFGHVILWPRFLSLPQSGCTSISSPTVNLNGLSTVKEDVPQSGSQSFLLSLRTRNNMLIRSQSQARSFVEEWSG